MLHVISSPTDYQNSWDFFIIIFVFAPNCCGVFRYARCTRSVSIGETRCTYVVCIYYFDPTLIHLCQLFTCAVPPAYYAHLAAFRARYYIEGDTSDSGSTRSGSEGRATGEFRPLPVIMDNVKDVMFYC